MTDTAQVWLAAIGMVGSVTTLAIQGYFAVQQQKIKNIQEQHTETLDKQNTAIASMNSVTASTLETKFHDEQAMSGAMLSRIVAKNLDPSPENQAAYMETRQRLEQLRAKQAATQVAVDLTKPAV
jgi:type IV pilus biogenesis protein CpaD/CtpE